MQSYTVCPSASDMIRNFSSERTVSQVSRVLLAAWLVIGLASAASALCECEKDGTTVRCSGCTSLPRSVAKDVGSLIMTGNQVSRVQVAADASPSLASLKAIYLDNNHITALRSGNTCPFQSVMVLDLSANKLEYVEEWSIACNQHLKRLVLNDNSDLRMSALWSLSLKQLYLERCGLTSFDKSLLRLLPKLRDLYLSGNDALPCAQVARDLRKHRPDLRVHCEVSAMATITTTTAITTASSTTISPNSNVLNTSKRFPRFGISTTVSEDLLSHAQDTVPPRNTVSTPVPLVPLIVILAVVLVALTFGFLLKSRERKLPEDPY